MNEMTANPIQSAQAKNALPIFKATFAPKIPISVPMLRLIASIAVVAGWWFVRNVIAFRHDVTQTCSLDFTHRPE